MTTATWRRPNFTQQSPTDYKAAIEACPWAYERYANNFRVFNDPSGPGLGVIVVNAGLIWNGETLLEIGARGIPGLVTPAVETWARIFMNPLTGALLPLLQVGTPPPVPNGFISLATIRTYPGQVKVAEEDITDERITSLTKLPPTYVVTGDTDLEKVHLGSIVAITSGPATVTLPPLAEVRRGQSLEIVSLTNRSQIISPADGEQLEGIFSTWRLPSYTKVKLTKLNDHSWYITERPPYFVGQIIEVSSPVDEFSNVLGPGFWPADGTALDRVEFSNIGEVYDQGGGNYLWGNGDGSTTFNLPDTRGRVAIGSGQGSGLTNRTIGQKGGAETHVLTQAQLPSYNLPIFDPGHAHESEIIPQGYYQSNLFIVVAGSGNWRSSFTNISVTPAVTGLTVPSGGSGLPHNNMAPFTVTTSYIKV